MTTEEKIKEVLKPLIEEVRNEVFLPEYRAEQTEEEIVGIIVSKYFEWSGDSIEAVAMSAFEDANFHDVEIKIN